MLKINELTFGYKNDLNVIDNLTLHYTEPGVYGLLGSNGAGKSTLLYLMMGLLRPKSGNVTVADTDTTERRPEILQEMFIVPEEYDLPQISLPDYVNAISPFYPNFDRQLLIDLLSLFNLIGLNGAENDKDGLPKLQLRELSMGQKKKVYMCVALACRTKILLMDEPTNGLDIPSKSQFRKVIARGMREDQLIIVSTHQVRDVEQILDHVTIIDHNKVLVNQAINMDEPLDLEEMFNKAVE